MTDLEPNEPGINRLLRHSLAAPRPQLPFDFDARLQRGIQQQTAGIGPFPRRLLATYAVSATLASAAVMRNQGLGWGTIALLLLGPIAVASALAWRGRLGKAAGQTLRAQ